MHAYLVSGFVHSAVVTKDPCRLYTDYATYKSTEKAWFGIPAGVRHFFSPTVHDLLGTIQSPNEWVPGLLPQGA